MERFAGIRHSGGTGVFGLFILSDTAVVLDPEPFRWLVRTALREEFARQTAVVSLRVAQSRYCRSQFSTGDKAGGDAT